MRFFFRYLAVASAVPSILLAGFELGGCASSAHSTAPNQNAGDTGSPGTLPVGDGGEIPIVLDGGGTPTTTDAGTCHVAGDIGLWDVAGLKRIKQQLGIGGTPGTPPAGDPLQPLTNDQLASAVKAVIAKADSALMVKPVSVMDKTATAPSGDKHDYTSLSTYWWPDPTKADAGGLPYVRMDGQINPERNSNKYDFASLTVMATAVTSLGLGYFFTNDDKYAQQAATLLTTWFLDPATKMNPNLNYSQEIPGVSPGRQEGVLDGMTMANMLDSVGMLQGSASWTAANQMALEQWFSQMLGWLRTASTAMMEEASQNNHGTWYDVQTTRYAALVGQGDIACQILQAAPSARIAVQVSEDGGGLPLELTRADPFHYELYDLTALFDLATLARGAGMDLFDYQTPDGRGLHKAFDFMVPYVDPQKTWPYPQTNALKRTDFIALLRRAAVAYDEPEYEIVLENYFASSLGANLVQLTYPK